MVANPDCKFAVALRNQGLFFSSDRMMQLVLTKHKLMDAGGTVAGFVEAMPAGAALHGDGVCKEF